jgi:hypothetical protein
MAEPILANGGSKGGTGKSLFIMILIHFLNLLGKKLLLVETDTSNPDVWGSYESEIPTELVNMDTVNGWARLLDICHTNPDRIVLINTAARNNVGVNTYGNRLNHALGELGRELTTFWLINRNRASLELLKEYMAAIPNSKIHVVRNLYFGEEQAFELYNDSELRKQIESRGGKSLNFPEVGDRVTDEIYTSQLSISKALKELSFGNRIELEMFIGDCKPLMQEVLP